MVSTQTTKRSLPSHCIVQAEGTWGHFQELLTLRECLRKAASTKPMDITGITRSYVLFSQGSGNIHTSIRLTQYCSPPSRGKYVIFEDEETLKSPQDSFGKKKGGSSCQQQILGSIPLSTQHSRRDHLNHILSGKHTTIKRH